MEAKKAGFRPMTREEFALYREWSIKTYAEDLVRAGTESEETAWKSSREEFDEMLPMGYDSPDNYLYVLQNGAGCGVGMLWYQRHLRRPEEAFVAELYICGEFRRQGYGREALRLAEEDARAKGFVRMGLSVFRFNTAAFALYQSSGWKVSEEYAGNCIMQKEL